MHRLDELLGIVTVAAAGMFAAIVVAPLVGGDHLGAGFAAVDAAQSADPITAGSASATAPIQPNAESIVRLPPVDVVARRDGSPACVEHEAEAMRPAGATSDSRPKA